MTERVRSGIMQPATRQTTQPQGSFKSYSYISRVIAWFKLQFQSVIAELLDRSEGRQ